MEKKNCTPLTVLNMYFKSDKFSVSSLNGWDYENSSWSIICDDTEQRWVVGKRVADNDTGADFFDEVFDGNFFDCVNFIRGISN
jgi:hypothetical protein